MEQTKTIAEQELEILKFWKDKKIYEKSRKNNSKGKKFYLMDGPPYATGNIHMGTALNKISKDIAMRAKRIEGYDVFDRAGYDTHGVPIEFKIEKVIGSKSKNDIERFGVKKFIDKCKHFATQYIDVMNQEFENLGVWMDFKNPYLTLDESYVETIWDCFKVADEKKLLYLDRYPIHICPRCETAVAYNEIEYAKQEDTSVFVKFQLKDRPNTFLIIWTTTPWTLPGNTGVMVNPNFNYQEIELSSGEKWIMAEQLVPKIMAHLELGFNVRSSFPGKDMKGWKYVNPLSKNMKISLKKPSQVVVSARYVNLEEGTGLVHCAPGHGKEDYEVGKEAGLDIICPVDIRGVLTDETGKYAGGKAREIDKQIIEDLANDKYLIDQVKYTHDYPLCWRCKSPLLMVSLPQWFLKISEIQKKILEQNEKTEWNPSWMKLRMKAWLEGVSDWPVSRKRYWGTPLPIWTCECGERKVIGSKKELEKLSGKKVKEVHKPEIDEITIKCKCGEEMTRVPEVLDVWFDSGVSSWAALDEKQFKKFWPADMNIEGKDQVRGWWNSQMILSEIKFGKKPFERISVHGMVLDVGKKKMSKSLGNSIAPQEVIDKHGRDYLRYYFAKISKGEDFAFDEKEFAEIGKVIRVLQNVMSFVAQLKQGKSKTKIEDKWIAGKFDSVKREVYQKYAEGKFSDAIQLIEQFLVVDLSRKYIQMIRERQDEISETMNEIRVGLLQLLAPIMPILTEKIWQELKEKKIVKEESVHLSKIEFRGKKKTEDNMGKEFDLALKLIELGLAERDKAKIGLKWPLAKAVVYTDGKTSKEIEKIIENQLNVKKVELKHGKEMKIELDTAITPELETEGFAREISRNIQSARKNAGFVKQDNIELEIVCPENFVSRIETQKQMIQDRTNAKKINILAKPAKNLKNSAKFLVKDFGFEIYFEKF